MQTTCGLGLHAFTSPRQDCSENFRALAIVVYSLGTASLVRGGCKDWLPTCLGAGDSAIEDQRVPAVCCRLGMHSNVGQATDRSP